MNYYILGLGYIKIHKKRDEIWYPINHEGILIRVFTMYLV